jgi:hypothetical protein
MSGGSLLSLLLLPSLLLCECPALRFSVPVLAVVWGVG